jgi:hypothetical protein
VVKENIVKICPNIDSPPPLSIVEYSNNWYQSKVPSENLTTGRKIFVADMEKQENFSKNGAPLFDGTNYSFWSIKMRVFLMAQGFEVWNSVVNGYKAPTTPPTDANGRKLHESNSKAMNSILSGLLGSEFVKFMHCESAKDIWDKLKNIYEGDEKVKQAKLQTHRAQFEGLKMKEDEDIATYFLRVDGVVNTIRGLGEEIKESIVVQKVLRSLPLRFDPKVSTIEESSNLKNLKMDELHGILTAYEMRMNKKNHQSMKQHSKHKKGQAQKDTNQVIPLKKNQMQKKQTSSGS